MLEILTEHLQDLTGGKINARSVWLVVAVMLRVTRKLFAKIISSEKTTNKPIEKQTQNYTKKSRQKRPNNDYLLTVQEVARMLRVSSMTVSNLAKRGTLKCVDLSSNSKRKLRFSFNDVMDFIDEKRKG